MGQLDAGLLVDYEFASPAAASAESDHASLAEKLTNQLFEAVDPHGGASDDSDRDAAVSISVILRERPYG